MDKKIASTGAAIGTTISKYKSEYMLLIAVLVMVGGYVFSAFMYMDMCEFMEKQTLTQVETAKVLSELNVRMSEVELELKAERQRKSE